MRWAFAASVFVLAGCPRGNDSTPRIVVSEGAARRIGLVQSRAGKTQTSTGARARVHSMVAGEQLGGPNATGKPGDWMLDNDEVVFVVEALGGGVGFAESGGNVVDAADAKVRKDELGQLFTYFGSFPRQAVYGALDARVEPDGTAVVEAKGRELLEPAIEVTTQYRLGGGDRALLLRSTLKNTGTTAIQGLGLGDVVQWGGTEKFAPGKPRGFKGHSSGPYVGGIGRFVSYAITSTEGEIAALNGGAWTDTEQKKNVALAPGASVTYERVFVVGERPDVASVVTELAKASGEEVGAIDVALVTSAGAPVKVAPGAKLVLGTASQPEILSVVATKEGDSISGEVPPGSWILQYAPSIGRRSADKKTIALDVKKGAVARATLAVTEPSRIVVGACEESGGAKVELIPCRLTFEGRNGTPSPDFGPRHVAGPAKNQVTLTPEGVTPLLLPHGSYRITASRGPEYDLAIADVDLPAAPDASPRRLRLRRVVDTAGYVATDFHQHTIVSADAPVATRDRVVANAAEGVEVAVASEHNVVVDLGPIVKEAGLSPWLVEISGTELTTDASKEPWGHANVFPLTPQLDKPRGGAPAVRDRGAPELFAEVRALPGGPRVIQINHPRAGKTGYFDQLGFDPAKGIGTKPGYDAAFDALEVWNGRNVAQLTNVLGDYMALLRTGHPSTPIADTDTHGIVGQEAGYPRTYVRLKDDELAAWDEARTRGLVKAIRETRDVVLTNGPFLRVSANGAPLGGIAKARDHVVQVKVDVVSAPWIEVRQLEIRSARSGKLAGAPLTVKKDARGALSGTVTLTVRVGEDDALIVLASGTKPMRPVLDGDDAEISPFAISAPIWIDVDGDGKSLGR